MPKHNTIIRALLAAALALAPGFSYAAYTGSAPLIVANGGTGQTTLTAHGVLLGQGTSGITTVSPGSTAGVPLIAQGASSDPVYGTVLPVGGGSGLSSPAAHSLMVAEGSSNFALLSAAADSIALWQSSSADPTVTAINNCTTALTYATGSHAFGCNASVGVIPTEATASGSGPFTLATTNLLTTVSSMGTPAAATYNLPTIQAAGWRQCLKDGTTGFATNNATVKPNPTSLTIDGVAGTTGIVMNQNHQELCFMSDGTNWLIE